MSNHSPGARPRGAFVISVWSSTVLLVRALFRTRLGALLPLVIVLLLLSLLIALTGIIAPVAPFIYPLF